MSVSYELRHGGLVTVIEICTGCGCEPQAPSWDQCFGCGKTANEVAREFVPAEQCVPVGFLGVRWRGITKRKE
jgi:hypothetical protein